VTGRERRTVLIGGAALGAMLVYWFSTSSPPSDPGPSTRTVSDEGSVSRAELRVNNLRRAAAGLHAIEANHDQVAAELADREKGLIQADTAAQAQARLLQILREIAHNQNPPLEIRQTELGQALSFGDAYGQVSVSISMECSPAQLVNYIAYLSAQKELIATDDIRFGNGNLKNKTAPVRLTVSAIVPRKLVPEKKTVSF